MLSDFILQLQQQMLQMFFLFKLTKLIFRFEELVSWDNFQKEKRMSFLVYTYLEVSNSP